MPLARINSKLGRKRRALVNLLGPFQVLQQLAAPTTQVLSACPFHSGISALPAFVQMPGSPLKTCIRIEYDDFDFPPCHAVTVPECRNPCNLSGWPGIVIGRAPLGSGCGKVVVPGSARGSGEPQPSGDCCREPNPPPGRASRAVASTPGPLLTIPAAPPDRAAGDAVSQPSGLLIAAPDINVVRIIRAATGASGLPIPCISQHWSGTMYENDGKPLEWQGFYCFVEHRTANRHRFGSMHWQGLVKTRSRGRTHSNQRSSHTIRVYTRIDQRFDIHLLLGAKPVPPTLRSTNVHVGHTNKKPRQKFQVQQSSA